MLSPPCALPFQLDCAAHAHVFALSHAMYSCQVYTSVCLCLAPISWCIMVPSMIADMIESVLDTILRSLQFAACLKKLYNSLFCAGAQLPNAVYMLARNCGVWTEDDFLLDPEANKRAMAEDSCLAASGSTPNACTAPSGQPLTSGWLPLQALQSFMQIAYMWKTSTSWTISLSCSAVFA